MPGSPRYHKFVAEATIAAEIEGATVEEYLLDRVASGDTLVKIGRDYDVSRDTVRKFFAQTDERWAEYQRVWKLSAHADSEIALEEVESTSGLLPADVQKANAIARVREKRAAVKDREVFGEKPAELNVNIGLGELMLPVMRELAGPQTRRSEHETQRVAPARSGQGDIVDAPYEVIDASPSSAALPAAL